MKKTYRVKSDKDFQAIFDHGENVANRRFVVYRLAKQQQHFRAGISVGKKIGNAVIRNAVKRKIRHALMEFQSHLASDDFVVIARKGVESLDYHEIKKNLRHVLKLAKLYQEGSDSEKKN
ncbi:ribonuclease P protein component [Streptococcus sp. H49]|uniref:ribonuclease P protein component n=1 Tax=Streptococcus huangxiaojuni TaxID=3237239 RepID=UPI0034A2F52F